MPASRRLAELPLPSTALSARCAELRAAGLPLVDLAEAEGGPPAPESAPRLLAAAAVKPEAHRAPPPGGLGEFRRAVARWYADRHGVRLDPDMHVLPVPGARQGLFLVSLAACDLGDVALVPDPSFPAYRMGAYFAGAEVVSLRLRAEMGYLPDLAAIPEGLARRARILFLNYPNNPTGAAAPPAFFADAVAFARRRRLLLCHDFAYGQTGFGGYRPPSLLAAEGALQTSLEFVSLSESFGLPGWRLGAAVGGAEAVAALFRVSCQVDGGVSPVLQAGGADLLDEAGRSGFLAARNETWRARCDILASALQEAGLAVRRPRATPFLWVACPGDMASADFARWLLDRAGVAVTPGSSFGAAGEGFVRLSLRASTAQMRQAAARISALGAAGLRRAPEALPACGPGAGAYGRVGPALPGAAQEPDALLGSL